MDESYLDNAAHPESAPVTEFLQAVASRFQRSSIGGHFELLGRDLTVWELNLDDPDLRALATDLERSSPRSWQVEPFSLELAPCYGALLASGALTEPLQRLAERLSHRLGILLEPPAVHLSSRLGTRAWQILAREVPLALGRYGGEAPPLEQVVPLLCAHVSEVVECHAAEFLGLEEVGRLVARLRQTHPILVGEVLSEPGMDLATLHLTLKLLVAERIPVRDLVTILESIRENLQFTRDPVMLCEFARIRLARSFVFTHARHGELKVATLDPGLESTVSATLDPNVGEKILHAVADAIGILVGQGEAPVLVTAPPVRRALRNLTERSFPRLTVLSWNEIPPGLYVDSVTVAQLKS